MTTAEHYKTNLRIALPVMIGQLGHIMVSVADSIMVGQLGTFPLAAVAFGNSIYVIFMVFGIGITYGITPLVAQAAGKGHTLLQSTLLRHSLRINLLSAILLFGAILATLPFLGMMSQEEGLLPLTAPYLLILGSSIIPLMVFQAFKQFAEGLSDTQEAMKAILGCNLINIILNYLLIYGNFGFPELGINGAAWATFIARFLMVVWMGWYVLKSKKFKSKGLHLGGFKLRKRIARKLIQLGVPMGLQYIFEVSAFAIAAIFVGTISAVALAAHQIAINIASVSYMAVTGLGAAATVRIGNQLGAKDGRNLKIASLTIFQLAAVWMTFTGMVIYLYRYQLASFYSTDPEVIEIASTMLIVAVLFQLSDGIQAVALGALRGLTDVKIPTWITFLVYWLLVLPASYFLPKITDWGALGIWYALAVGLTISAFLLTYRFRRMVIKLTLKWSCAHLK
ncbi:MAG: MATE family efflux transporter [Flavobacteriales bacterium]|nr:MATE family efflux transporter [Flavobacteriales bacterium]